VSSTPGITRLNELEPMPRNGLRVLDLFCGCGGLSMGFLEQGYDVVAGVDNWDDALRTFGRNHSRSAVVNADLSQTKSAGLFDAFRPIDVVIGGPPCQGFSISGRRDTTDPRNELYKGFVRVVRHLRPTAIVLENVPNLVAMAGGAICSAITADFAAMGYDMSYKILLASQLGVPQNRRRVFFVGTLGSRRFRFPDGTQGGNPISCSEAISDLPEESTEDGSENPLEPQSEYQAEMRRTTSRIYNHVTTQHTERTVSIISLVPDGGDYRDLPEALRATRKVHIAWTRFNSSKPSYTIDTGHRHHFHYRYNRVLTVRECARIQSFPDDFVFLGSKTNQYRQVGNAVPPRMARAVAASLQETIGGSHA